MEINITTGYKIFEKHYDRIAESLGASNALGKVRISPRCEIIVL